MSQTSKAKRLIEIATNRNFKINLHIFERLIGTQPGNIKGRNLIFCKNHILDTVSKRSRSLRKLCLNADFVEPSSNVFMIT